MSQSRIKRLPDNVINKIAAGEVVERPSSVVKELVENALDAGATQIEVAIEAGGKNFIQIMDNGCGMSEDEMLLALDRHATSKLDCYEDLEKVGTMGFRGEALPSIAAVSRFELQSRTAESKSGSRLIMADGKITDLRNIETPCGTRITVRNLFFSTPARRKFLTSNRNELRHLIAAIKKIALAKPQIKFSFISDGEELYDWPAVDSKTRVEQIFGVETANRLIEIEYEQGGLSISGFAGKVNTFRRSYGDQYIFINSRPISSRMINHAVFSAYGHTLQRGQLPFFLLFLEIDPKRIDVNVHPAKKEVRFEDERFIHQVVSLALRKALALKPVNNFDLNPDGAGVTDEITNARPESYSSGSNDVKGQNLYSDQANLFKFSGKKHWSREGLQEYSAGVTIAAEKFARESEHSAEDRFDSAEQFAEITTEQLERIPLFQLHNTYILVQVESGLVIIDQHVAHERILYEACLRSMQQGFGDSQRLLFPVDLDLTDSDRLVFEEILQHLISSGFEMQMDKNLVRLTGIPVLLKNVHPDNLIKEIIDQYRQYQSTMDGTSEAMAASIACRTAIKAGQTLNQQEMRQLVDNLFTCHQPFTCPHGRPIVVNLGLEELHKRFDRG
jgi:DNA mismatch repair protein MutL